MRGQIWAKFGTILWKKQKKSAISMFFLYFALGIHLKHNIVFIEIPEWNLKAKLARNTIFEGN